MTFKGFIRNRQETIGILGLLLIVLSLTGLLGCPSPTPPAESATPMTGTFTYEDLTTAVGNQKEGSPEWSGNADKQLDSGNIGYTITPPSGKAGTGVTINPDDGKITVGTTATVEASSGTYTVKASGSGAFTGEIKATVKVTINATATPMEGELTYDDLTVAVGSSKEISPSWSGNVDKQLDSGNIEYTITPPSGKAGTGVTINTDNGKITVGTTATAEASSGTYTVKASGSGAFTGEITATVKVTINASTTTTPITGTFTYEDLTTAVGNQKEGSPSWSGNADKQLDSGNIGYTISPSSGKAGTGVTINTDDGKITVGTTATVEASSGTYTVKASGSGAFTGEITATVKVTINATATPMEGTLTYDDLTVAVGNSKEISPIWSGNADKQLDSGNIGYTISPSSGKAGTGVTINTDDGKITVGTTATAEASSGRYTVTATGKGAFQGTITATIQITITAAVKTITGSFSYDDITIAAGNSRASTPKWIGGDDYDPDQLALDNIQYTLDPPSNNAGTGVTLYSSSGSIAVGSSAPVASSGTYTVTAKGIGAFQGTITSEIKITINAEATPITGSFSYEDLTVAAGNIGFRALKWSQDDYDPDQLANGNILFSIEPPDGNTGTGVGITWYNGDVLLDSSVSVASSGTYTVTATGKGIWGGTITSKIKITINAEAIPIIGSFSYDDLTVAAGNTGFQSPKWSGHDDNPDQITNGNIHYRIDAPPGAGVAVYGSGNVTISASASAASSGTYTVTATGLGIFGGTITTTIKITITE